MENEKPKETQPIIPDTFVTPVQPKSHLDKLAEVFLPEDLDSIGNRIVQQVVIPNILKTAGDILHKSIDLIFGTNWSGVNTQSAPKPTENYTAYRSTQSAQSSSASAGTLQVLPNRSGVYDFSEVRFRTQQDAQNVVNNMRAVLNNTGRVSVATYLQFAGAKTIPEDFNYGWTKLENVYVQETNDRDYPYRMVLPAAQALTSVGQRYYL